MLNREVVGNRTRVKVIENKSVAAGTRVCDPSSASMRPFEEIVAGEGKTVVAADRAGHLHVRPITQRFDQGEAEVISLELRDGTTLQVTSDASYVADPDGHLWELAHNPYSALDADRRMQLS